MEINLIFFSPTGGSRRVVESIASVWSEAELRIYDITREALPSLRIGKETLTIMAMPVYAGRLPSVAVERIEGLTSDGGYCIPVVTYGNREFEDALLELDDLMRSRGFIPVSSAAFVAEHSYSTDKMPLSVGRPDAYDVDVARRLGETVRSMISGNAEPNVYVVPGDRPYKPVPAFTKMAPDCSKGLCVHCGVCVKRCPVHAISKDSVTESDKELCIKCRACVKACPTGARTLFSPFMEVLFEKFNDRKEAVVFG